MKKFMVKVERKNKKKKSGISTASKIALGTLTGAAAASGMVGAAQSQPQAAKVRVVDGVVAVGRADTSIAEAAAETARDVLGVGEAKAAETQKFGKWTEWFRKEILPIKYAPSLPDQTTISSSAQASQQGVDEIKTETPKFWKWVKEKVLPMRYAPSVATAPEEALSLEEFAKTPASQTPAPDATITTATTPPAPAQLPIADNIEVDVVGRLGLPNAEKIAQAEKLLTPLSTGDVVSSNATSVAGDTAQAEASASDLFSSGMEPIKITPEEFRTTDQYSSLPSGFDTADQYSGLPSGFDTTDQYTGLNDINKTSGESSLSGTDFSAAAPYVGLGIGALGGLLKGEGVEGAVKGMTSTAAHMAGQAVEKYLSGSGSLAEVNKIFSQIMAAPPAATTATGATSAIAAATPPSESLTEATKAYQEAYRANLLEKSRAAITGPSELAIGDSIKGASEEALPKELADAVANKLTDSSTFIPPVVSPPVDTAGIGAAYEAIKPGAGDLIIGPEASLSAAGLESAGSAVSEAALKSGMGAALEEAPTAMNFIHGPEIGVAGAKALEEVALNNFLNNASNEMIGAEGALIGNMPATEAISSISAAAPIIGAAIGAMTHENKLAGATEGAIDAASVAALSAVNPWLGVGYVGVKLLLKPVATAIFESIGNILGMGGGSRTPSTWDYLVSFRDSVNKAGEALKQDPTIAINKDASGKNTFRGDVGDTRIDSDMWQFGPSSSYKDAISNIVSIKSILERELEKTGQKDLINVELKKLDEAFVKAQAEGEKFKFDLLMSQPAATISADMGVVTRLATREEMNLIGSQILGRDWKVDESMYGANAFKTPAEFAEVIKNTPEGKIAVVKENLQQSPVVSAAAPVGDPNAWYNQWELTDPAKQATDAFVMKFGRAPNGEELNKYTQGDMRANLKAIEDLSNKEKEIHTHVETDQPVTPQPSAAPATAPVGDPNAWYNQWELTDPVKQATDAFVMKLGRAPTPDELNQYTQGNMRENLKNIDNLNNNSAPG